MAQCARDRRVFFVEEPVFQRGIASRLYIHQTEWVTVAVPHLPDDSSAEDACSAQRRLIDQMIYAGQISNYVLWYYTPMALAFTDHLSPLAVIYDCMDDLSAFRGAPPALEERETELMQRATLVLTARQSLYEAKRHQHPNVHRLPVGGDVAHAPEPPRIERDPPDPRHTSWDRTWTHIRLLLENALQGTGVTTGGTPPAVRPQSSVPAG
jgi:UDP-galactopyranose mutase